MVSTHGIHHITAIASDPQKTVDFYSKILGLRLVKKSVNQDDVSTYHLFFGDKFGEPGMDLTFFTFSPAIQGIRGTGQVTTISLTVPVESLDFWLSRFQKLQIKHGKIAESYGIKTLTFYDHDGQKLELVGVPTKDLDTKSAVWTTAEISDKEAIRYFDSATLSVTSRLLIEPILLLLGYEYLETNGHESLYQLPGVNRAGYVVVEESPLQESGLNAAGTVHHIAFQVRNEAEQLELREKVLGLGIYPTEVIDRHYFKSVYFRTPAGILFELATMKPGFTVDEDEKNLGKKLALPPFLEERREEIEDGLTPINN